ncbi:UPF0175 family protein [Algoriphagus taiwanensis]|uniref:Uncharacterized protein n=1 Tax=Algoriphagus taiwanensis TaxID=1445656 RepID=A0ABQ6PVR0_9BACT|nr:hypothetical protein Ataiwa_02960 [Algoriphagus taiwanensis]
MKTITVKVPESADEKEVKMQIAGVLFERGILSSGQAAELVGISKREFIESAGEYGVSVFGETAEDLKKLLHEKSGNF